MGCRAETTARLRWSLLIMLPGEFRSDLGRRVSEYEERYYVPQTNSKSTYLLLLCMYRNPCLLEA